MTTTPTTAPPAPSRTHDGYGELGPFELLEPLGHGAMGEVWRGRHRVEGVEVALKVITAAAAGTALDRGSIKREVQAMASLAHPNIVMVFEHGRVDRAATAARLPLGAPWLALELARSSLAQVTVADWPTLRFVLRHILQALAHAHAHGIVHRDLKPGNVLLIEEPGRSGAMRMALADFGIAHAYDVESRGAVRPAFLGTPGYTPPEQIATAWRDQGPWTDLYALGCVAWQLCAGAPPFRGADKEATFALHLAAPLPGLRARFPIPDGFRDWLRSALAKQPARRFRHAADTAWYLEQLDDLSERLNDCTLRLSDEGVLRVRPESPRAALPAASDARTVIARMPVAAPAPDAALAWSPAPAGAWHVPGAELRLPFRETWRDPQRVVRHARFIDVGLGLYDLRAVPFVDRDAERDQLWHALRCVHTRGRAMVVVVRGATGAGTSRLAEWIGRRAAEHGVATLLRASHSPTGGPASGLPPMLARHFACTGLQRAQLFRRLEAQLERLRPAAVESNGDGERDTTRLGEPAAATRWEAAALTELIQPRRPGQATDEVPQVHVSSSGEWHFILARVLRRVCARRPAIVWLDDAHWGLDALSLVASVLEDEREAALPVLFILTVRDDELASRPREAEQLTTLLEMSSVEELVLRPLSAEHHSELVAQLLPLAPQLREHVESRTAGNPLFAIQLVGEWVERDALVPGTEGFALRADIAATLPNSIHELWSARLKRVITRWAAPLQSVAQQALELAATLGVVVGLHEWRQVCAITGLQVPHGLLDALVGSGLALREHHSWRFVHVMLQESLLRTAADSARLRNHHAHCAQALLRIYGTDSAAVAERRGHHLVAAGRDAQALAPLADAVRHRLRTDDLLAAEQLLDSRESLLAALDLAPAHPAVLVGWLLRSELDRRRGALDAAVAHAERASLAHDRGDDLDAVRIRTALGNASLASGDVETALRAFGDATTIAETLQARTATSDALDAPAYLADVVEGLAEALYGQARVLVREGELAQSEALAEQARGYFLMLGDRFQGGWCSVLLASIAKLRDDLDGAERHIRDAWATFDVVGSRAGIAACTNMLAEVARARGKLDDAEWLYRRAAADWRAIGAWDYVTALLNVMLVKLRLGDLDEARNLLERIELPATRRGDRFVCGLCQLSRLATLPTSELAQLASLLESVKTFLEDTGFIERDLAFLLEFAADRLLTMGRPDEALTACKLALLQWRELDDLDEIERLEARSRSLSRRTPPRH